MPVPSVIDLSHHNVVPQSLQPALDAGIVGLIHKATEGVSFRDSKMEARRSLAQDVGMLWGVYHFIRPGQIDEQAAFFLDTAGVFQPGTLYALDYEDNGVSLDDVVRFQSQVEVVTGRPPVLYSGHVLKEKLGGRPDSRLSKYPLWLAQYGPQAALPPGWDKYWLWQYTENGVVPGINPPTDLNQYNGTMEQLVKDWTGTAPTPTTEAVVVDIQAPPGVQVNVILNGKQFPSS